jgi:hypothetical protein
VAGLDCLNVFAFFDDVRRWAESGGGEMDARDLDCSVGARGWGFVPRCGLGWETFAVILEIREWNQ